MKTDIIVPSSGESVTEGDIARWFKESGERVKMDEPLLELETDKASLEISAEIDGVLTILVEEGNTVEVGSVVGYLEPGDGTAAPKAEPEGVVAPAPPEPEDELDDKAKTSTVANLEMPSPAARKLMAEHGISAEDVTGTGKGGRITKADVLTYLDTMSQQDKITTSTQTGLSPYEANTPVVSPDETIVMYRDEVADRSAMNQILPSDTSMLNKATLKLPEVKEAPPAPAAKAKKASDSAEPPKAAAGGRATRRERMSRIRKTIASRLVEAQHTAAMLTTFNEVDMSAIMGIRSRYKEEFKDTHSIGLGFMSFFTSACCHALQAFPAVNARIEEDEIVYHDYCDIGIAVSTPRGLVVPVVRDAENMGFHDIERTIRELALKGRNNELTMADLDGGTFTITNGGTFGSMLSTPILNRPQSGILGMHNIVERPVAVDGQVVIRPIMYVALTYDHRIIDGAEAVQFLVKVKQLCEDPTRLMLRL